MKLNIRTIIIYALLIGSLALCGCGVRGTRPSTADAINPAQQTADLSSSPVPTASPSSTPAIQVTPAPLVTPKPSVSPTPAVSAQPGTGTQQTPIPTAAPQQTPIPTAAPAASGLPVVTKRNIRYSPQMKLLYYITRRAVLQTGNACSGLKDARA